MTELRDRLPLFPDTIQIKNDTLYLDGQDLVALAESYGTPLYVYDRATMDAAVRTYRQALKASYPARASITYAGKAFLCRALANWTRQQHIWLDCTGESEISVALISGLPRDSIVAHGCNKSLADLYAGFRHAGTLVVDNLDEMARIVDLVKSSQLPPRDVEFLPSLWLRFQPGVQVETHIHTQTGQADSKFGMTRLEIVQAARQARDHGLPIAGLHFHLGSNFRATSPLVMAIGTAMDVAQELHLPEAWHFSPGGGWAVAYHEDDLPQLEIESYVADLCRAVVKRCRDRGLPLPHLHLEPGRSLVARAGIAIYRVGAIKKRGERTWILTDGGMADNPRHALYGSRYSCLPLQGMARPMKVQASVAGPYCESGDILLEDLRMPELLVGEFIAVPVSGAYQLSMASNYNGARRPAVVWLDNGSARLIVRRESADELRQRDLSITQLDRLQSGS